MRGLQKFKLLPMLGLLVLIALVIGACAPAATTTAQAPMTRAIKIGRAHV